MLAARAALAQVAEPLPDGGNALERNDRAAALKSQGDQAADARRYQEALENYEAAFQLSHDPALHYNRGRMRQLLGDMPGALANLEAFKATAPPDLLARVPTLDKLISDVRSRVATLTVSANVPGARLLVRDHVVGTLPVAKPLKFNAGKASIVLEADGHFPFRTVVDLPGGGTYALVAHLAARATSGVLVVKTNTASAQVFVDGKRAGTAPVELAVQAGTHTIVARRPGHEDAMTTAIVRAGAEKTVNLALSPVSSTPVTATWWFWTAAGALAIGGAVSTYALLMERPPSSGDIAPGQVAAPLRARF